ncbi:MAG TPA: hypothetical protein VNM68_09840, partial [Candidatus Polarisedimenticolia bacterium]|nr:hypothetical protein [Candidatus Polarisedimenticolia bacterium]
MWIPALVFVVFAAFFLLLRSNDFFTVDGGFRCFVVYRHRHIAFDINNHLLYLADVLAWTRIAGGLGFHLAAPLEYFSTVEVMNCLAGAACLAIVCSLLHVVTASWLQAFGGTMGYGLSKAFIAQATNANQPMLGVFWSFFALLFAVLSLRRKSLWPICASGLLFALAMATYQSTILLAFAAVILLIVDGTSDVRKVRLYAHRLMRVGAFVSSGVIATVVIFGSAYRQMGISGPGAMVRHFFWHEEARVYLKMSVGKLLNVPIGMVRSIFPLLPSYNGIRGLLARRDFASWTFIAIVCVFCAFLLFCAVLVSRRWAHLRPCTRLGILTATVGFLFTMLPVVVYDPQYDKLWIQPLACLTVLVVIALHVIAQKSRAYLYFSRTISILLLIGVASNLGWVARAHSRAPYEIEEAQRLSRMIQRQDLLVGDWDHISVLYGSLWADEGRFFSFPTEAQKDGIEAASHLRDLVSETSRRKGRIYFLGIL